MVLGHLNPEGFEIAKKSHLRFEQTLKKKLSLKSSYHAISIPNNYGQDEHEGTMENFCIESEATPHLAPILY